MQRRYLKKGLSGIELGLSLVMLLLVLGGGLGYVAMTLDYVSLASLDFDEGDTLAEITAEIGSALDCAKTLEPHLGADGIATCAGLVGLEAHDGTTLLTKGEGGKRGAWTLRAVCDGTGLAVQASTLLPARLLTTIDPRDFAPTVGSETGGAWRDVLPRETTCRRFFQPKAGPSIVATHGSFHVTAGLHTETVRVSFRPQGATCTAGTQSSGCICGQTAEIGPTWVRFKAKSRGGESPPCFVNYMILGD